MSPIHVTTPVFQGPLELLLELIEKRKLFIGDVALAAVADEYIERIEGMSAFPVREVAQFVLVASTLVLIKSKSLLPELELSNEEEANIKDLERRLMLYKRIQELTSGVRGRFGTTPLFWPTVEARPREKVFAPHTSITAAAALSAARDILMRLPKAEKLQKVIVEKVMSLEEMIDTLAGRLQQALSLRFKDFAAKHKRADMSAREEKVHTIVSFLAMLELVKRGALMVRQHEHFSDIEMEHGTIETPNYA